MCIKCLDYTILNSIEKYTLTYVGCVMSEMIISEILCKCKIGNIYCTPNNSMLLEFGCCSQAGDGQKQYIYDANKYDITNKLTFANITHVLKHCSELGVQNFAFLI